MIGSPLGPARCASSMVALQPGCDRHRLSVGRGGHCINLCAHRHLPTTCLDRMSSNRHPSRWGQHDVLPVGHES